MRFQRALSSVLLVATLATPALGQEQTKKQKVDSPPRTPSTAGLVSIEVSPKGCTPLPFGPLQPSESCLGPVKAFDLDWLSPVAPLEQRVESKKGVGFVARADGLVVTSRDLVNGADRITVTLHDGHRSSAEVVTTHAETQTAILRVDANDLPALDLCDPAKLKPGDRLALGTREKRESGIFTGLAKEGEHQGEILAFFTGPLTPLPGAPILDADGHVVGLNARLLTVPMPGVGSALQFTHATPVETVRRLVKQVPAREPPLLPEFSFDRMDWDWRSLFIPGGSLFRPLDR